MKREPLLIWLLLPIVVFVQVQYTPTPFPPVVNAHESVESVAEIVKLQNTMQQKGVSHTILHAIPKDLLYFAGEVSSLGEVEENNEALIRVLEAHPNEFSYFCTLDPLDPLRLDEAKACIQSGARGVKLYNGYSYAHVLPLDEARLTELYSYLEAENLPLMLPVNTEEYEAELRNLLTLHPDLTVICPHFCLSSKNLERVTSLLNDFPNLYVDTSFGHVDFVLDGFNTISERQTEYQDFFYEFQDRILFATDNVLTSYEEKTIEWMNQLYADYFALLTEEEFQAQLDGNSYQGLNLPYSIQRKVFYQNTTDLLLQ